MAARTIDGPVGVYLTAVAAAKHLGISAKTLHRYSEEMPWLRPVPIFGKPRWHWTDIVCLGHILMRMSEQVQPPPAPAKEIQK